MEEKKKDFYLNNVKLAGYKSVLGVDINFKRGLNIIIGKNSAGKTNFLTFLNSQLNFSYNHLFDFNSKLTFQGESQVSINSKSVNISKENRDLTKLEKNDVEISVSKNDNSINDVDEKNVHDLIRKKGLFLSNTFIKHGIPEYYSLLSTPYTYTIDSDGFSKNLMSLILKENEPFFIRNILANMLYLSIDIDKEGLSIPKIKKNLSKVFSKIDIIKKYLKKYSPIEDMRFSKNFNIFYDKDKEQYTINNLFIEFKIFNNWHPFSNLSDGTKRLFYIISEVGYFDNFHFSSQGALLLPHNSNRIILIEEPELGIHPHQLIKLMEFLKEASENHQIIVTTHSPIILDILNKNELDRIIIAYNNNFETELRHLNDNEVSKALKYIKNDFLSDYWKYSDLEK